ncbi:hypothetical protein CLAFUW4_06380 [Fulvia fulva]|uniref:Uncharacterized protein n=1 Tax=Passalora fulva TaxID=5499 RepID=A0A9Q8LIL1_PASFU|nr:uncharacterized protein CLAFUR5_06524 [Fulvia fulva]KAK4623824.1 hypothetical protein CLAFUR4_06383 [Fulvia fulva]KAK4625525.1 hypothetical protein CLAFUR0_06384 [Fulvia fulva]UJO17799.1 hypothetical protein CLAFUR5_06524 [Fulvia fulva]WPV14642.1 hypothetical protein CLAFUW4_06380 [Fulvia fulva]WPV30358.1 hypothetical protein CLAFUW7_06378 [Fulvia fulva]
MHNPQSEEMSIDPVLLALDARAAEESANTVIAPSTDEDKLNALEALLPGVREYLLDSGDGRGGHARQDRTTGFGFGFSPSVEKQANGGYPNGVVESRQREGTGFAPSSVDQSRPNRHRREEDRENAFNQEKDSSDERIHFEMEDVEGKDPARTEYLAWLSKQ